MAKKMEVGRFTYGHKKLTVRSWGAQSKLKIGAFCSIADNVTVLLGGNHRVDWATTFPFGHVFKGRLGNEDIEGHPASNGDVVIGNDVWVGAGATIMSGVQIGDGAVIAANAHVASDVGDYTVVGGNPAKHIKDRFPKEISELLKELRWWELPVEDVREIAPLLSAPPEAKQLKALIKRYAAKR